MTAAAPGQGWNWGNYAIGGATRPDSFTGLRPEFNRGLQGLFENAPPEIQRALRVKSGYRSPERQAQIIAESAGKYGIDTKAWQRDVQQYGPIEAGRRWAPEFKRTGTSKWIGRPGGSKHQHGNAVDLAYLNPAATKYAHANAAKYGLHFPLANEDWHIEPIGARGGGAAQPAYVPPVMAGANTPAGGAMAASAAGVDVGAMASFGGGGGDLASAAAGMPELNAMPGGEPVAQSGETAWAMGEMASRTRQAEIQQRTQEELARKQQLFAGVEDFRTANAGDIVKMFG